MKGQEIIELLQQRGKGLGNRHQELKRALDEQPYFTALRLLYLKSLQEAEELNFDHELKRTAVHMPNRRKLFEWVAKPLSKAEDLIRVAEKESVEVASVAETTTVLPEEESLKKADTTPPIQKAPPSKEKEVTQEEKYEPVLLDHINDPAAAARLRVQQILAASKLKRGEAPSVKVDKPSTPIVEKQESIPSPTSTSVDLPTIQSPETTANEVEKSTAEKALMNVEPEAHSTEKKVEERTPSTELDKLDSPFPASTDDSNPVDEPKQEAVAQEMADERHSFSDWLQHLQKQSEAAKEDELLEKFLKNPPQFKPSKEKLDNRNIAKDSLKENPEIMTETLARLYSEQGHYQKAIQAYEILGLRFPEKSSFFAGRIRELRKRIKDKK